MTMKRIIFTFFLLLAITLPAVAQNQFWSRGFQFERNETYYDIPSGVTLIGVSDESATGRVEIPNTVTILSYESSGGGMYETTIPVVAIKANVFSGRSSITEVVIPANVTSIGDGAFEDCTGLTTVTMPRKLSSLGNGVFKGCTSLTDINWPHSLSRISNNTFYGCSSLRSITIPASVTSIGESAFAYCTNLNNVVLPNSVRTLDWNVFYCCTGLTNVTIPGNITSLRGTFFGCTGLTSINIPAGVTTMEGTFKGCTGLTSVALPRLLTTIGSETFADCSNLAYVEIPNSVTRIGSMAFSNTALTTLVLPSTVTNIESNAFYGSTQLASITSRNLNPPYMSNSDGFSAETYGMASLYIPASSVDKYQNANWWKLFEQVEGKDAYNTTYDFVSNGLYYLITANNTVTVRGGSDFGTALTIPANVTNEGVTYAVTAIAPSAFSGSGITSLSLPETLVTIGANAFSDCNGLTSLTIPVNVTSIGSYAFSGLTQLSRIVWNARECWTTGIPYEVYGYGKNYYDGSEYYQQYTYDEVKTNVTEIIIGNQVKVLPRGLAANSQITSINLPTTLEVICEDAFYDCGLLTSMTVPVNVNFIGEHSFCNCDNLSSLTWNARSCPNYGGLYYKINYDVHTGYSDNTPDGSSPITELTIGDQVETLPDNFARSAYITSAELPASLKTIGDYAFYNCWNMSSEVIIGDAVTEIGDCAFGGCAKVTRMSVGRNVRYIGQGAFGSGYENNPNSYHYYGDYVPGMSLTSLSWYARQCESAGNLSYHSLTSLYIDDDVEVLPNGFASNSYYLTGIRFPSSLRVIGEGAFKYCYWLTSLNLPPTVTTIGNEAFIDCNNLMELNLPNSLESIGSGAFSYCGNLKNLYIPASVTFIGQMAFRFNGLETIVVDSENPVYDSRDNCNAAIHTADNSLVITCKNTKIPGSITAIEDYAFYQSQYTGMDIPNSVITIGKYAFAYCYNLQSITIPNSVTTIGEHCFYYCPRLKSVTLSESLTAIEPYTFADCDSLTSIRIPASVSSIAKTAFYYCDKLAELDIDEDNPVLDSRDNCNAVIESANDRLIFGYNFSTIPSSVKAIGDSAFADCAGPVGGIIPNTLVSIGDHAFDYCYRIKDLDLGNSLETIGDYAFKNCDSIEHVNIGTGLKSIGNSAFYDCDRLKDVKIGGTLSKIGEAAFDYCQQLTSFTIQNSVDTIGSQAFYYCSNLKNLQLGRSLKVIGPSAFYRCNQLSSVTLPNTMDTICNYAFEYCKGLKHINLGTSLKGIGNDAFYDCDSLTSILIPNSTRTIGQYAFYNCDNLKSLTIGNSVKIIRDDAFNYCQAITSVNSLATTPPTISYYTFHSTTFNNATLYVPEASLEAYKSSYYWKKFKNIVGVPGAGLGDVDGDGNFAINDVTMLIDAVLGDGDISVYGDVNGDGTITIADITMLIDMITSGQL